MYIVLLYIKYLLKRNLIRGAYAVSRETGHYDIMMTSLYRNIHPSSGVQRYSMARGASQSKREFFISLPSLCPTHLRNVAPFVRACQNAKMHNALYK